MLLSEDHGHLHSGSCPPDLRQMIRLVDIELSDESHQESLDLHETEQKGNSQRPGKRKVMKEIDSREPPAHTAPDASREGRTVKMKDRCQYPLIPEFRV